MAHVAELKSSRVIWKQKPLACNINKLSETLQGSVMPYTISPARSIAFPCISEIMAFRSMAEGLDAPLETFPESYHPLIAKLVHGRYRERFMNISRADSFVHL